jgi:hypothetical protein
MDSEKKQLKKTQDQINKSFKNAQNIYSTQARELQQLQPQYEQSIMQGYESQIPMLQQQFQSSLDSINLQRPLLQQQFQSGMENIGLQKEQTKGQRESALATARRQYEQGLQKSQQLFGGVGGSSAGMASADILGAEQLRQTGQAETQSAQNLMSLGTAERGLQGQYTNQLQQLELAERDLRGQLTNQLQQLEVRKQQDLMKLRDSFRQELNQINSQRGALSLNKANAQLSALQDYNTRKRQLEDMVTQQRMNLESYAQQAAIQFQYNQRANAQANQVIQLPNFNNMESQEIADNIFNLKNTETGLRALSAAGWNPSPLPGGQQIWTNSRTGYTLDTSGIRLEDNAINLWNDLEKKDQTIANLYNSKRLRELSGSQ